MERGGVRWRGIVGAALVAVVSAIAPLSNRAPSRVAAAPASDVDAARTGTTPSLVPPPCRLCASEDPGVPVQRLTVEAVEAIGHAYSDSNRTRFAVIDSMLQAGVFGPAKSRRARNTAHLLARMAMLNAYSYMIRYGSDPNIVWEADEATLGSAFASFSDPGIVPLARLRRARMGLGHMCAQYDLNEKIRSEITIGGRKLAVRIDDVRIGGLSTRALIMDLPTSLHDVVEVWIASHVSMDVVHPTIDGPPSPYEAYILERMQGLWVHRGGIHRPEAFVFWVTPRSTLWSGPPPATLIGARIYVPHLRLRLPGFLPDIGFEDLREVDLPQPILSLEWMRNGGPPNWVELAHLRGFKDWEGSGPLPAAIRERFPDL